MTIGVVGLGLIGGSLAKSIHRRTDHTVLGYDINPEVLTQAILCEAVQEELTEERLSECQVVLVALYPSLCVDYITRNADRFADGALVVDCAGVKRPVCEQLFELARGKKWKYIGGHPMAGREYSGFSYAIAELFQRASMILTPPKDVEVETLTFAKQFFLEAGFGSVRFSTPEEHDSMIAYTSQLAHIVSGAYVKNPLSAQHKGFSAGSFLDMTRVARLNENMWTELCMDNADLLVPSIDDLIMRLTQYREALDSRDAQRLCELLREGRIAKESLSK